MGAIRAARAKLGGSGTCSTPRATRGCGPVNRDFTVWEARAREAVVRARAFERSKSHCRLVKCWNKFLTPLGDDSARAKEAKGRACTNTWS